MPGEGTSKKTGTSGSLRKKKKKVENRNRKRSNEIKKMTIKHCTGGWKKNKRSTYQKIGRWGEFYIATLRFIIVRYSTSSSDSSFFLYSFYSDRIILKWEKYI